VDYRTLGASGCALSSLCLGTMTFGSETDEPGAHRQLDRFVEAGGTFIDTADVYSNGVSGQIIGRWLADRRGTPRTWQIIDAAPKVASERGVSMAEVALAWVAGRPAVTSTILGARTEGQLDTSLRAAGLRLTAEEVSVLDTASDPGPPDYPHGELGLEQRGRRLSAGTP